MFNSLFGGPDFHGSANPDISRDCVSREIFFHSFGSLCEELISVSWCRADDFDNFIKVGVYLESDLDCILRALKVLFPKMTIFLICPRKLDQLWKIKFRNVFLVEEEESFG